MKCALIISALLAVLVGLSVAHEEIPVFARSCSLCRLRGSPRSCTPAIRTYVQCDGMYLASIADCTRRAGLYLTENKRGCYLA
uniref:Kazal-like domain-containing protein n=1 Tax=Anopheles funestus TaxID=62324 RepID=A0A182S2L7_ANOFN